MTEKELMLSIELDYLRDRVTTLEAELHQAQNDLHSADLEIHQRDRLLEDIRKRTGKMLRRLQKENQR